MSNIPEKAVDRYELRWYTHSEAGGITEHRAIYHVSTCWADAEQATGPGANFCAQWQIFNNGRFVGRSGPGWEAILASLPDELITSRVEAGYAYRASLRQRIRSLQSLLAEVQQRLSAAI